jgi:hypothetical protein
MRCALRIRRLLVGEFLFEFLFKLDSGGWGVVGVVFGAGRGQGEKEEKGVVFW